MLTILKDAKDKLVDLKGIHLKMESELEEIKRRKEVHVKGGEYNNGVYLQSWDIGYDEIVNCLEMLLKRYNDEICKQKGMIDMLEEIIESQDYRQI